MITELDTWEQVAAWTDEHLHVPASYLDRVNKRKYPVDAFSLGQLASKAWMLEWLKLAPVSADTTAAILGCWIGAAVPLMYRQLALSRVYGIDMDPESIALAEDFNRELVNDNWKFKGVVADVSTLQCNDMEFQTGGELITVKPDWIINTSCEHMDTEWFHTVDPDQLIIMQTNDSPQYDGHINICDSEFDMWDKYPMSERMFSGALKTPAYTRFMQIGYK